MSNTIKLKKCETSLIKERIASAAITPGMLIELISTDKVRAHATVDGTAARIFALEDELQGKEITEAYAADAPVQCWYCQPGEEVYALLADGENVAIGDKLVSNGNGYLKKREGTSSGEEVQSVVAQAVEARDLSGSSGADDGYRIKVEVM